MTNEELREFANYQVLGLVHRGDEKADTLCVCHSIEVAKIIAFTLAKNDPASDPYYVTRVSYPYEDNGFCIGGGWHIKYQMDGDGKVTVSELC